MRWNFDPILMRWGALELRYYGILFAFGILLAAYQGPRYFRAWKLPIEHAEKLAIWVPIGMLLGAHYVHLAFYEPAGLTDFRLGLTDDGPVIGRFWNLASGLASHGGGLGCVLALLLFWYRHGRPLGLSFFRYADATMLTSIWVYPWVRLANFINSEIIGRPTDGPFGVIFVRAGMTTPRHPVVLYEAVLYFVEIGLAVWFSGRYANRVREGSAFLGFLAIHFSMRFFCEFFKESQHIDQGWALNMGHWLSLPIVVVAGGLVMFSDRFSLRRPLTEAERAKNEAAARWFDEHEAELDAEEAKRVA